MVKTRVINNSKVSVEINEGNAGVYTKYADVPPHSSHILYVNEHATYREYWCAVQPNDTGGNVLLTSDDCAELEEIEIYIDDETGKLQWKPGKNRNKNGRPTDAKLVEFVQWIRSFFRQEHT